MTARGTDGSSVPLAIAWGVAACALLWLAAAPGCHEPPSAADSNRPLPGDVPGATTRLDERTVAALQETLRTVPPEGFEPPQARPLGERRWSDVPAAVSAALLANGGAVLRSRADADGQTFTFKLTDGRLGTVVVTRAPAPTIALAVARVDSAVPAANLEKAIEADFDRALTQAAGRRRLDDVG